MHEASRKPSGRRTGGNSNLYESCSAARSLSTDTDTSLSTLLVLTSLPLLLQNNIIHAM